MAQQRRGMSARNVAATACVLVSLGWLALWIAWVAGPWTTGSLEAFAVLSLPVIAVGLLLYKPGPAAGDLRFGVAICVDLVIVVLGALAVLPILTIVLTVLLWPVALTLGVACALRCPKPDPLRESGIDDATAARLEQALALSEAELSQLLSVPRGGLRTWLGFTDRGRPAARLAAVCEIVTALDEQVGHDHVAEVVRRPMPTFGGRSLLEAMTEDPGAVSDEMAVSLDVSITA